MFTVVTVLLSCDAAGTERKELIMFPHSTARFEMFDAAKNKLRVKVSYLMIALIVAECICMVIEDKKVRAGSSLSLCAFPKTSPQFSLRRLRSKKKPLCINLLTECFSEW